MPPWDIGHRTMARMSARVVPRREGARYQLSGGWKRPAIRLAFASAVSTKSRRLLFVTRGVQAVPYAGEATYHLVTYVVIFKSKSHIKQISYIFLICFVLRYTPSAVNNPLQLRACKAGILRWWVVLPLASWALQFQSRHLDADLKTVEFRY